MTMTSAQSRAGKAKGRRGERLVRDYLRAVLPEGTSVDKTSKAGNRDEADVRVVLVGGQRFHIEVKYRTTKPGRAMVMAFRSQAEVETMNTEGDLAILVTNVPGVGVEQWTVHWRPLTMATGSPRWLTGEAGVWLPWLLRPTSVHEMEGMFR